MFNVIFPDEKIKDENIVFGPIVSVIVFVPCKAQFIDLA